MPPFNRRAFSIRIFLPDGVPDGVRTVEKSNWIGRAIVCPRSRFKDAKSHADFGKIGVYVLIGPSGHSDLPTVYIGEGDTARERFEKHITEKDFWTSLVLFTSKDTNLNKAHVQYLESRLYGLAREANRCILDNVNVPQPPSLSDPDIAEVEGFLDEMLPIYPLLGITAFEKPHPTQSAAKRYYLQSRGIEAEGYEDTTGFVVLVGSEVAKDEVASVQSYLQAQRTTLQERGVIAFEGDKLRFTQTFTFDSPSTAAGVLLGRSTNGRTAWKDAEGRTLRDNQTAVVGANGDDS